MVTLYKRATPSQARILNIIEGAIKNVAHKSGQKFDPYYARSVAKRAAGTLTAQMPDVLATVHPPPGWIAGSTKEALQSVAIGQVITRLQSVHSFKRTKAGRSHAQRSSPLRLLEKRLASQMRDIKKSGNIERARAFVDVLRIISAMRGKGYE